MIVYMIGIVLANGERTLYRDPRAKAEEERPAAMFLTPTEAMLVLPYLKWRKCGDGPADIEAYGKRGEIYYLVPFDTAALPDITRMRRSTTKLTTGDR